MKFNFLIAEEIRPEASGKQTVLGLFPDNTIVIEPQAVATPAELAELPAGLDRLTFLLVVSDEPDVKHSYKVQITDPSGQIHVPDIPCGETTLGKNSSRSIVIEAKPFVIKGKGTYHLNLYIDDELHSFPFRIIDRADVTPSV